MKIVITAGRGEGSTTLSAFDAALKDAGIQNYNLIRLSSIIPPKSKIVLEKYKSDPKEYGNKLYIVLAEERSEKRGKSIAAGIGWYVFEGDGRGVFVEQSAEGKNEKEAEEKVIKKIEASIKDLCKNRNQDYKKEELNMIISKSIVKKPTCVVVSAVFKSEKF